MSVMPKKAPFRVSSRTIQMLGRENIASPVIAVLELVKNAYDADADWVKIIFRHASMNSGYIEIEDNGTGMDWPDIEGKWLTIGTANKKREPLTLKNRVKIGEKGIGRLATNLLGNRTIVETHQTTDEGLRLEIDWTKYENDEDDEHDVHEIEHSLSQIERHWNNKTGTLLRIDHLNDRWSWRDYTELHKSLTLLVPPLYQEAINFTIHFDCDEAPDISGEVSSRLDEATEYMLESTLSAEGEISHKLNHRDEVIVNENRTWDKVFNDVMLGEVPRCGSIRFLLRIYLNDIELLKSIGVKRAEIEMFLARFRGIHIYRDNFRVETHYKDWLDWKNLQKHDLNFNERHMVGTVFITREHNPDLQDQANRQDLKMNDAFKDMQRFIQHCVYFIARERKRHQEQLSDDKPQTLNVEQVQQNILTSRDERESLENKIGELRAKIDQTPLMFLEEPAIQHQKVQLVQEIEQKIEKLVEENERYEQLVIGYMQEERQLLFGLSTLGIAMATFGHETKRAINQVLNAAEFLKKSVQQLPVSLKKETEDDLNDLNNAANQIANWAGFGLDHIRRDKRTQQKIDINKIITTIFDNFSTEMTKRSIQFQFQNGTNIPSFRAFRMDIEAILINFLTNAVEALKHTPVENRRITVKTVQESNKIMLQFSDSGRGILPQDEQRIFEPLFTTKTDNNGKPIGTGLGLTIVKNVVEDYYRGTISVQGQAELGGAKFTVLFPVRD
jgi:hypothetical protein